MPQKIKTTRLPWQTVIKRNGINDAFYNKTRWRAMSIYYRQQNPTCEACNKRGIARPVIQKGVRCGVTDHIIRIEDGGSKYDERNHMSMCSYQEGSCHDRKRALEARTSILIPFVLNEQGEKIPADRNDIINLLNKDYG